MAMVAVLAAVFYVALVPANWYGRHVPLWIRLPLGITLGALWLLLFVGLPLWARFFRRVERSPNSTRSSEDIP